MHRKGLIGILLAGVTLVLPAAGASASPAHPGRDAASTTPVTFTGAVRCDAKGRMTLSPAYTLSGSKKRSTLKITLSLSSCGGSHPITEHGVTITGGSFSGSISTPDNSCVALSSRIPALSGKASFTAKKGTVTPTKVTYSVGAASFSHPPIVLKFPLKGGTVKQSGSFAGKRGSIALTLQLAPAAMLGQCQSTAGLRSVQFPRGDIIFN